ncbi:transcription factor 7-like 1 [Thalassophryne amazonica]|uniref:transcription factor 7-like 1 n=1 Tax=Thalassophryne amazonica TaxID=390379 RepID=UPI00147245C1|nr:transcription factor 7-like 1 [Thalassophryne amazonica]
MGVAVEELVLSNSTSKRTRVETAHKERPAPSTCSANHSVPQQTCADTHTGVEAAGAAESQKTKYVKKPANAFMIYMRVERQGAVARYKVTDSAQVNQLLGKEWKNLTNNEKAKYYKMAEEEKALHSQMNPNWSFKDNYRKRAKKRSSNWV